MNTTHQLATFHLDGSFFGIEVEKVQEVIRYQETTRVPLTSSVVQGLVNPRGQIVTAIDLRRRLELQPRPDGELPMNVVGRTDDGAVSLLVDEIGDETSEQPTETVRQTTREPARGVYQLRDKLLLVPDTERTVRIDGAGALARNGAAGDWLGDAASDASFAHGAT